jgi:hypothetical protein
MRRLVVIVAACSYRGTLPAWGTHVAFPCVDLAVAEAHDARARDPVIAYAFGNRCDHRVTIDFTSLRVVARDVGGREVALAPYDPRHEIRPLPLPGRMQGSERIEYDAPEPIAIAQLCVDVGRFAPGDGGERWTCIAAGAR